jgi:hypothetical protein
MLSKNKNIFSKTDIEKYFNAEKAESRVLTTLGIAAILLALVFVFFFKISLHKGMAIPLAAVGTILAIVGITVYSRSDRQRNDIAYAFENNPEKLKSEELPRMKKVMKSFIVYRWIEIIIFIMGTALYIYFIRDFRQDFWRGFGFTLAIMAAVALSADYYAEKRGRNYTRGLETFTSNPE